MSKELDLRRLDVRRFAEEGRTVETVTSLQGLGRLRDESQPEGADREVHWSARGELRNPRHVHPQSWIHLRADASLALVCQRCLLPVDVPVTVDRSFRFAPDESTAAAEDDAADEEVLADSRSFDLLELLEDELLMEMPVAPRHEICPESIPLVAEDPGFEAATQERKNPFAMLGRLKAGK